MESRSQREERLIKSHYGQRVSWRLTDGKVYPVEIRRMTDPHDHNSYLAAEAAVEIMSDALTTETEILLQEAAVDPRIRAWAASKHEERGDAA